jgi:hypothetical protein
MKKPITALVAAGALGLAMVSTTQPARAMDPWTAAAWFVGGMFTAAVLAPAFRPAYAYAGGPAYAYAGSPGYGYGATYASWAAPQQCYWTRIRHVGVWRNARVCF